MQHTACLICFKTTIKTHHGESCPQCKSEICQGQLKIFQAYKRHDQFLIQSVQSKEKEAYQLKKEAIQAIIELCLFFHVPGSFRFKFYVKEIAMKFMKQGDFESAEILFEKLIEMYPIPTGQEKLYGFGLKFQDEGWGETKDIDWYQNKYGFMISLYDYLSLCYLKHDFDYQRKKEWHLELEARYPDNLQILYGLAVAMCNEGHFKQLQPLFDRILLRTKAFVRPFLARDLFRQSFNRDKIQSLFLENQRNKSSECSWKIHCNLVRLFQINISYSYDISNCNISRLQTATAMDCTFLV